MYKVENLLILVIKQYIFTCKYNSTKNLIIDDLFRLIYLSKNIYCLEMVNMLCMKNTGGKL